MVKTVQKKRNKYDLIASILEFCRNVPKSAHNIMFKCNTNYYTWIHIRNELIDGELLEIVTTKSNRTKYLYLSTDKSREYLKSYYALIGALYGKTTV